MSTSTRTHCDRCNAKLLASAAACSMCGKLVRTMTPDPLSPEAPLIPPSHDGDYVLSRFAADPRDGHHDTTQVFVAPVPACVRTGGWRAADEAIPQEQWNVAGTVLLDTIPGAPPDTRARGTTRPMMHLDEMRYLTLEELPGTPEEGQQRLVIPVHCNDYTRLRLTTQGGSDPQIGTAPGGLVVRTPNDPAPDAPPASIDFLAITRAIAGG